MQNLVENIRKKFEQVYNLRPGAVSTESYQLLRRVSMTNTQTEIELVFITMKELFPSLEAFRNEIARYAPIEITLEEGEQRDEANILTVRVRI